MGYLLPVPLYQYQDYQERVTRNAPSPFYIEGVYKSHLDTKHKQIEQEENRKTQVDCKPSEMKKVLYAPRTVHKSYLAEKIYADVTGKGRHFSETI
ncbi:hypothetical protein ERJ70_04995 [Sediminibacillus dalangtanensis]|uniref:Uncharacterized protein n=1 Tax=Sediminibacillus dalangtanensis TaxID=2729421 RepID=A0ABX7VRV0_9BACI|nr:hypothetical protein [Sediminibacillus dalangtanensis]QTM98709.1 hypothetical protein ERJ70_04995 [Sediminibacillus dalangtanensis]